MSTIESKDIIKTLLENDGCYPGDPQMYVIWSYYNTMAKRKMYAVYDKPYYLMESSLIQNPIILWSQISTPKLTAAGEEELAELRKKEM